MRAAGAALCAFAAAWVFYPVLSYRFVNLEDYWLILDNPHLRAPAAAHLRWMFTSLDYGTYQPLGWLAYAGLRAWRGLEPWAFHLGSWLAHAACAALLFLASARVLKASVPGASERDLSLAAAAAAATWALHPMRVEQVAWATGLPDVLATMFFLAAALAYLTPNTALCLVLYIVSSLFRWKGVSLPVALVALDVLVLRRPLNREAVKRLLPFLSVAVVFGAVNAGSKRLLAPGHELDLGLRTLAGPVYYLGKLLWPSRLTLDYWVPPSLPLSAAFLLISAALLADRRRRAPAAAAWACFCAALAPSLLMSFRGLVVAHDRATYLPAMSLHVLLGAGVLALLRRGGAARAAALAGAAGLAACFSVLSRAQLPVWRDSESLWRHALSRPAPPDYAHLNLAHALLEQGRRDEAAAQLREQLRLFPGDPRAAGIARALGLR